MLEVLLVRFGPSTRRATSRRLTSCVAAIWTAIGLADAAHAQSRDQLFEQSFVHEIRLYLNSRDLAELREHYDGNKHYPADFRWGSLRLANVAVRSRGFGSRNPIKLGLRIDF